MHGFFRYLVFATVLRVAWPIVLVLAIILVAMLAKLGELVDSNLGLILLLSMGLAWLALASLRPGTLHQALETIRTAFRRSPDAISDAAAGDSAEDPVEARIRDYLQDRQQPPSAPPQARRAPPRGFGKRRASADPC